MAATDTATARDPWHRYLAFRGRIAALFWIAVFAISAAANTVVTLMDAGREGVRLAPWQPALWEASSAVVSLLLLPFALRLCSRWPMYADNWVRRLPGYVLASVAWSLLHVLGMVLLRKLGYALAGDSYDPGGWTSRFLYEYLKDARTFAMIVLVDHGYRWFWLRLQGEARLLGRPDDAPEPAAGAPPERPERFLVRKLGREFLVAASDVEWLQASGNYVNLHVRGRDYPLRSTIAGIEASLDPARFVRIHRSYIVNLDRVVSLEPLESGDARVQMDDGTELPCSRTYRNRLRQRLEGRA